MLSWIGGSALAMSVSPRIASQLSFNAALWVGAVVMVSGLILFIVYMVIDQRDEIQRGADDAGKLACLYEAGAEVHYEEFPVL